MNGRLSRAAVKPSSPRTLPTKLNAKGANNKNTLHLTNKGPPTNLMHNEAHDTNTQTRTHTKGKLRQADEYLDEVKSCSVSLNVLNIFNEADEVSRMFV
jgi:hypothetical protein